MRQPSPSSLDQFRPFSSNPPGHQVHHSPSRIEVLTSFYKHPVEILCDAILSAVILYPLMGCSLLGAFWYNFFAGTGENFLSRQCMNPMMAFKDVYLEDGG
jgi:hypothetical protein